jgi:hypothetical protein
VPIPAGEVAVGGGDEAVEQPGLRVHPRVVVARLGVARGVSAFAPVVGFG